MDAKEEEKSKTSARIWIHVIKQDLYTTTLSISGQAFHRGMIKASDKPYSSRCKIHAATTTSLSGKQRWKTMGNGECVHILVT